MPTLRLAAIPHQDADLTSDKLSLAAGCPIFSRQLPIEALKVLGLQPFKTALHTKGLCMHVDGEITRSSTDGNCRRRCSLQHQELTVPSFSRPGSGTLEPTIIRNVGIVTLA